MADFKHPFVGINTSPSFTFHCPQQVTATNTEENLVSAEFSLSTRLLHNSYATVTALRGTCDTIGGVVDTYGHYVGVAGYAYAIAPFWVKELRGVFGFAQANTGTSNVQKVIGVYGLGYKNTGFADVCYGGYFRAEGGTKNVGVYAESLAVGNYVILPPTPPPVLGTLVAKIQVFKEDGTSLGFIPVYDNIT
jgi:hypothetical protein